MSNFVQDGCCALPVFGIQLERVNGTGTIESDLHDFDESPEMTAAINAIEQMILAHYIADVHVTSTPYIEGILAAVEAAGRNFQELDRKHSHA